MQRRTIGLRAMRPLARVTGRSIPMTVFSLDRAPSVVAPRARRPGWFARFIAAVQDSRMRSAQAVIARYRGFMPVERPGDPPNVRNADPPQRIGRD